MSNIYYLVLSILSAIPQFAINSSYPSTAVAFSVVLLFGMIRDLTEDLRRQRSDNQENQRVVRALIGHQFCNLVSKDLLVGQIIEIHEAEVAPADILLLECSNADNVCYIETSNLDGETTTKTRMCERRILNAKELCKWSQEPPIHLKYDPPNIFINKFEGVVSFKTASNELLEIPVDKKNVINRGCSLKNTDWARGVVVYTGHDTKIMMNLTRSHAKISSMVRNLNRRVLELAALQITLTLFAAFYDTIWLQIQLDKYKSLAFYPNRKDFSFGNEFITAFALWNILIQQVPFSIIIQVDAIRIFQSVQIIFDKQLSTSSGVRPSVQDSKLLEELGKVSVIFSDKTGTLTKNIMNFCHVMAGGKVYGFKEIPSDVETTKIPNVRFYDPYFMNLLKSRPVESAESDEYNSLQEMVTSIALCHDIIADSSGNYHTSSADELALVNFALFAGMEYKGFSHGNNNKYLLIDHNNGSRQLIYDILKIFEFTPERRRMSVVVSSADLKAQGKVRIITKGADLTMLSLACSQEINEVVRREVDNFSNCGLRTLVYGVQELSVNEFSEWESRYKEAEIAIVNRKENMQILQAELEKNLRILGVTAVEDTLQDNVYSTLQFMRQAGLKVWMITGDKAETATNIARTCGLVPETSEFLFLDDSSLEAAANQFLTILESNIITESASVVISGIFLDLISAQAKNDSPLLDLIQSLEKAKSVIICRASPKQKADIVSNYKKAFPQMVTMAVGDGANDTAMLVAANVSIGIKGFESQAARVSDFAVGEFQQIKKLMFFYGRECYRRNTNMIRFLCYVNAIGCFPTLFYQLNSGLNGQTLFDSLMATFFALLFTGTLGSTVYAVFDQEYTTEEFMTIGKLYDLGRKNQLFTGLVFWSWILKGAIDSIFLTLFPFWQIESCALGADATLADFWTEAMIYVYAAVLLPAFKAYAMSNRISFLFGLALIIGPLVMIILHFISSTWKGYDLYYTFEIIWTTAHFYLVLLITLICCTAMDLAWRRWKRLARDSQLQMQQKIVPVDINVK